VSRILVDTHALLWFIDGDSRCTTTAREAIRTPNIARLVSAASIWELAIKSSSGRLGLPDEYLSLVTDEGFSFLPVDPEHAWASRSLPARRDHKDPFDRMIAAQALCEGLPVISADRSFDDYGVERIW
jgi:PIN domain nuclease of toxin-antitoxin system